MGMGLDLNVKLRGLWLMGLAEDLRIIEQQQQMFKGL